MRFNKAFADGSITFFEIEVAGLAAGAVEFFGLLGRGAVAFNFTVKSVFAGFDHGRLRGDFKFILELGLRLDIAFDTATERQRPISRTTF